MNQALRQRILGLLVLVALASVVLPLVLDFGGDTQIDTRSQLPPAPTIQPTPLPGPASTEPQAPAAPTPAASDSPDEPQLFQLAPGRDAADAGAAATDAQVFNLLQSMLWLDCVDSCPDCIAEQPVSILRAV